MSAKILLLDIETAPKKAYVWSMWKENISLEKLQEDGYILCWAAKWLGTTEVMTDAIWLHSNYRTNPEDDSVIVKSIHDLLDQADVVIAHNGDNFDLPIINSRCVIHGMIAPSSYKTVDTLKIARSRFKFTSNRLDGLGRFLKVGRKLEHSGMQLWVDVLDKVAKAQKLMLQYNIQDVLLLERVYNKLRGWDNRHPNLSMFTNEDRPTCAVCGSDHIHKKGFYYTNSMAYPRYKCAECGHNMRGRFTVSTKEERENKLVSTP